MNKTVIESEVSGKLLLKRIKKSRNNERENVVVFCGGKSFEHDISILTAQTIVQAVPSEFNAYLLYQSLSGEFYLVPNDADIKQIKALQNLLPVALKINDNRLFSVKNKPLFKIDVAINCGHGQNCEEGTITHLFSLCNIASTNANATSQAVTLDKEFMKNIFVANGFATPKYVAQKGDGIDLQSVVGTLGFPIIVKPANLGSSIGICVCKNAGELENAVALALKYDTKVVFEEFIENALEINCACANFDGRVKASSCETPQKNDIFLSFHDKYLRGGKGKMNKMGANFDKATDDFESGILQNSDNKQGKNTNSMEVSDSLNCENIDSAYEKTKSNMLECEENVRGIFEEENIPPMEERMYNVEENLKQAEKQAQQTKGKGKQTEEKINYTEEDFINIPTISALDGGDSTRKNKSNAPQKKNGIKTTFCHSSEEGIVIDEDEPLALKCLRKKITSTLEAQIRKLTEAIYKKFDCDGVVRIDYLVKDDIIYVNEINSIPGSLAFYLFSDLDISDFVRSLIVSARRKFDMRASKDFYFDTHIC